MVKASIFDFGISDFAWNKQKRIRTRSSELLPRLWGTIGIQVTHLQAGGIRVTFSTKTYQ